MKNIGRVRAFLTEFVLVILFFSLSAVIALQLFLKANDKSEESKNMTMAYIIAERTAEEIKAAAMNKSANENMEDNLFWYDEDWVFCNEEGAKYVLAIHENDEQTAGGELVNIIIVISEMASEEVLCELPVTIYRTVLESGVAKS